MRIQLGPAPFLFLVLVFAPALANPHDSLSEHSDSLDAQSGSAAGDEGWRVDDPGIPSDTLRFETNEGTWMSVDVHPDGQSLVFDHVGDIYTMSIAGGRPRRIASGLAYEIQPRWSPDGSRIAFTSDRDGADNIWTMKANGSDPVQITKEEFRLLNNPSWHPSGEYIVARKHFTSRRSLGAGEMWMYRVPDGGGGVQLTERKNDQQDANEPVFSPDGRFLYWSEDMSGGSRFEYNKDPNGTIYVIRSLEIGTGEVRELVSVNGGAVRPQISPDGKTIAFVRRVRTKSVLSLFDLATGRVRHLWDGMSEDQQETWAIFGSYPGFDWTPDGRAIVTWAQGELWKIAISDGTASRIPFELEVEQAILETLRFPQSIGNEQFPVKVTRWPRITPDRKTVVLQALGVVFVRDIQGAIVGPEGEEQIELGPAHRLTRQSEDFEFAPVLSPDGKRVLYTTWNDRTGGQIRSVRLDGKDLRTHVETPGHYPSANYSPDGSQIVYRRGWGDGYRGDLWTEDQGIYIVDVAGKNLPQFVTRDGTEPRFSKSGERLYLQAREGGGAALISVNLLGSDRRVHATSEYATDFQLSPDERWLAFEELWQTYVVPFPVSARTVSVSAGMGSLPVKKLSRAGGTYLSWSNDSREVRWSLGPKLRAMELERLYGSDDESSGEGDGADSADVPLSRLYDLAWNEVSDIPATDLYLVGGRLLPMITSEERVIEDGVVHVRGNRIVGIGSRDRVKIPDGANILDVTGKTVMPGFVDVHAHTGSSNQGMHAEQNWAFLTNLAFGVTTTHDPSNNTQMIFGSSELVQSGRCLGPRIFSTGTILYGADGSFKTVINSYEDAKHALERTRAWGAFSVKSYNQPRRSQRQMIVKAGHELEMMVVPEGGSTLHHNMTMILDGHTTVEHAIPVAPLYEPEIKLFTQGTAYTPTLVVGFGGVWGENYWYQKTEVWKNERLMTFVPRSVVDPRSRRRTMIPDEEFHHITLAQTAAEIVRQGGNVEVGAHGQLQGLGIHWEFWMFEQGGMTPYQALRAATWMGAKAIGLDHQLGSLQPGYLADLIVIDGDPLENIRESENVLFTMINGRLFDAMTMEQRYPERKALPTGPELDTGLPVLGESDGHSARCLCH